MPTPKSTANNAEPGTTRPRRSRDRSAIAISVATICVALVGVALHDSSGLGKTPAPITTVKGIMASKKAFFEDEEVKRLLRGHHIEVEVTVRGSREVAREVIGQGTDRYDFAFPSGQPTADLILDDRRRRGAHHRAVELFSSPLVFASYREYAQTLVERRVAKPLDTGQDPLHYVLDLAEFIRLGEEGRTWNDIGIEHHGIRNGNRVLAHSPGVCRSNSAATYLGLAAFVKNHHNPPRTEAEVEHLAEQLRPLFAATGLPEHEPLAPYLTPEGKSRGPVVVVYEHEYLAYQIDRVKSSGKPDAERVLLYPDHEFQTDPTYISLKPGPGDQLADLLRNDPDLRRRMVELGFRVFDETDESKQLFSYLDAIGIPAPRRADATRAFLPQLDLLESLIGKTGGCDR